MIDVLFVAWNRLAFTRQAFHTMLANTDWNQVSRLVIYDDGSTDGTAEFLLGEEAIAPIPAIIRATNQLGPVGITNDYLQHDPAEIFAKIDNDTMVPPGWLNRTLEIFQRENMDLLGIECRGATGVPDHAEPTHFIGGIGLMRRSAFDYLPTPDKIRFGFTKWQSDHTKLRKGWLEPSLPVCLLDLVPFDPWRTYSDEYIVKGWQREWSRYPLTHTALWEWWA